MQDNTPLEDIEITCRDCGKVFVFTVAGQKFFEEKGYHTPVRCKPCRAVRKRMNAENPTAHFHTPHDE